MQFAMPLDARTGTLLSEVDREGDLAQAQRCLSPTDSGELGIVNLDVLGSRCLHGGQGKEPGSQEPVLVGVPQTFEDGKRMLPHGLVGARSRTCELGRMTPHALLRRRRRWAELMHCG